MRTSAIRTRPTIWPSPSLPNLHPCKPRRSFARRSTNHPSTSAHRGCGSATAARVPAAGRVPNARRLPHRPRRPRRAPRLAVRDSGNSHLYRDAWPKCMQWRQRRPVLLGPWRRGVLAGVTSSGDDACMLDDTQQRSDQPYIDQFIQAQIDAFEGEDPCRADGVCDETCNSNGQLGDPDCAANHCGADGICAGSVRRSARSGLRSSR